MRTTFHLACLYVVLQISACTTDKNKKNKVEAFPVTNPIVLDTTFTQDYVADIHAIQNVEIRARLKGFIDKIHVDEGHSVQEGQLLFTISSQEFKQALLRAESQHKNAFAELKIAEVAVNNTKMLVEQKIVSKPELDMAVAKLEAAEANVEEAQSAISSAKLNLSFASIRAPFAGIINRLPLKAGSLVDEGSLLTTISNDKEVFAYFNLSEKQYLSILREKEHSQRKIVRLVMADGLVFPYEGKIETAESEIDKNTGNLAFRARFKNPERHLKHGASGKLQLLNTLSKAMLIPQKATFEVQENEYVFVVDKNNKVQSRAIVIGNRLSNLYVVESGLLPDDRIIYEGIQRVKEGDKIIPEIRPMRSIMSQLSFK